MKCPYCKYEWETRVNNPKKCPACQRWLIILPDKFSVKKFWRKKEYLTQKEVER